MNTDRSGLTIFAWEALLRRPHIWIQGLMIILIACGSGGGSGSGGPSNPPEEGDQTKAPTPPPAPKKPKLTFVSPDLDIEAKDEVRVIVDLSGDTKKLIWALYYKDANQDGEPQVIAQDLAASIKEVPWTLREVPPGVYTLEAEFSSPLGKGRVTAKGKVKVLEQLAPKLTLLTPTPESVIVAGTPVTISFKGSSPEGGSLTYKIEYSTNGGQNWIPLIQDLTKPVYSWDVKGLPQGINYNLRVTGTAKNGLSAQVMLPKPFGVAATPITYAAGFGKFLGENCASCHIGGAANADRFRCDSYDLADIGVSAKTESIKKRVLDGTMPPQSRLTPAQKEIVTLWSWSGAN